VSFEVLLLYLLSAVHIVFYIACLSSPCYYNPIAVKATKKLKSCACCIGGDDDEDEDAENEEDGEQRSAKPEDEVDKDDVAAASSSKKVRSKYVDGKNQYAFDPTMFNKM